MAAIALAVAAAWTCVPVMEPRLAVAFSPSCELALRTVLAHPECEELLQTRIRRGGDALDRVAAYATAHDDGIRGLSLHVLAASLDRRALAPIAAEFGSFPSIARRRQWADDLWTWLHEVDPRIAPTLIAGAADPDRIVSIACANTLLIRHDPGASAVFAERLAAAPGSRAIWASFLGSAHDAVAADALTAHLATDADPAVRAQCAEDVAACGYDRAAAPLLAAMADADREVRIAATKALGAFIDREPMARTLTTALGGADPGRRIGAALALGEHGDANAAATLIATLADERKDLRCRCKSVLEKLPLTDEFAAAKSAAESAAVARYGSACYQSRRFGRSFACGGRAPACLRGFWW